MIKHLIASAIVSKTKPQLLATNIYEPKEAKELRLNDDEEIIGVTITPNVDLKAYGINKVKRKTKKRYKVL